MNLNLKIMQNIMILAFGVSSLIHASSSSSSSIAQGLVRAAAGQGASIGHPSAASPSADNEDQHEDEHSYRSEDELSLGDVADNDIEDADRLPATHNPASAQSSSAGAIAEAPMLAMWTSSLASSSSSSANNGGVKEARVNANKLPTRMHECPYCGDMLQSIILLNKHRGECSGGSSDTFECSSCHEKFDSVKERSTHQKRCYMRRYKANKDKAEQDKAVKHKVDRPIARAYECLYCDRIFESSSLLNTHRRECSGGSLDTLECSSCHKKFNSVNERSTHQKRCYMQHDKESLDNDTQDQKHNNKATCSSSSSSSRSVQHAQATVPAPSANNGAPASSGLLLLAQSAEIFQAQQVQSNHKRKNALTHEERSSKKQKIDQQEVQEYAQSSAASSSSASAAVAATAVASSVSSSSASSSSYAQASMPNTQGMLGLSSAGAIAPTALLAEYARSMFLYPAASSVLSASNVPLSSSALSLGEVPFYSNSLASAQASALPITTNNQPFGDTVASSSIDTECNVDGLT